jgi:hypothetical protein
MSRYQLRVIYDSGKPFDWGTDTHWADGTPKNWTCVDCGFTADSPTDQHDCEEWKSDVAWHKREGEFAQAEIRRESRSREGQP